MKIGTTDIKDMFLGTIEVKKIFSGTTLLYEKLSTPSIPQDIQVSHFRCKWKYTLEQKNILYYHTWYKIVPI